MRQRGKPIIGVFISVTSSGSSQSDFGGARVKDWGQEGRASPRKPKWEGGIGLLQVGRFTGCD